jgi:hypothetical protein
MIIEELVATTALVLGSFERKDFKFLNCCMYCLGT